MSRRSVLVTHDGAPESGGVIDALLPWLDEDADVRLMYVDEAKGGDVSEQLDAAAAKLGSSGAKVVRITDTASDAAGAILDAATKSRPDLLAMSTHGRSGIQRWVRGSVAERVLRACPVPVFMVNPTTRLEGRISSVLIPLDASENATSVLDVALSLAKAHGAGITLVFVDWDDPTDTPEMRKRRRAERSEDVKQWLARPRERVEEAGLSVDVRIVHGDVAEQIVELTRSGDYDLLAMTTHGRSGPGRWLLGSIAEKVLRECRVPVLLQRSA